MGKQWTREELIRVACEDVATKYAIEGDELAALARAWGLEVVDPLPTKLLTSPMPGGHFRVHDEAGKTWLIVDTCDNLSLLNELIQARHELQKMAGFARYTDPAWFEKRQQPEYLTVQVAPCGDAFHIMAGARDAPGPERRFCTITNCSLREATLLVERYNANS